MSESPEEIREKLLRQLDEADSEASQVESVCRQAAEDARQVRDIVGPAREMVVHLPSNALVSVGPFSQLSAGLNTLCDSAKQLRAAAPSMFDFGVHCSSVTNTTNTTAIHCETYRVVPQVEESRQRIFVVQEAPHYAAKARRALQRLGVDSSYLDAAEKAYRLPSLEEGAAASVLIPVRESINLVIDVLLKRRPHYGKITGGLKGKINDICTQCAVQSLDQQEIASLAHSADLVMNKLSGIGKQDKVPRSQVRELYISGLAFIVALVDPMDESRMRPRNK